jgi:hypothetical protein
VPDVDLLISFIGQHLNLREHQTSESGIRSRAPVDLEGHRGEVRSRIRAIE